MALPILAGLGAGKIISIAGGSGLVGNVGNLLTSSLGSIATNPIGTLTNIGTSVGSAVGNFIGGIFGGKPEPDKSIVQLSDKTTGSSDMQGVIFYLHDANYQQGGVWLAGQNCPDVGPEWNDNISGVAVAPGFDVEIYEHHNYGGNKWKLSEMRGNWKTYNGNEPHIEMFGGKWWNDKATSFKIIKMRSNALSFPQMETQTNQRSSNQPVQHGLPPNNFVESNFIGPQLPSNPVGNVGTIGINPFPNTTSNNQGSSNSMMYILLAVAGFFIFKKMK